jgi:hypothetical protein
VACSDACRICCVLLPSYALRLVFLCACRNAFTTAPGQQRACPVHRLVLCALPIVACRTPKHCVPGTAAVAQHITVGWRKQCHFNSFCLWLLAGRLSAACLARQQLHSTSQLDGASSATSTPCLPVVACRTPQHCVPGTAAVAQHSTVG